MKKTQSLFLTLFTLILSLGFASCGSDDDEDNGSSSSGSSTLIVNNTQYRFSHGYYWNKNGTMFIEFFNYDLENWNSSITNFNYVGINYPCDSEIPQSVSLSGSDYSIYFAVDLSYSSGGYQGETNLDNSSNLVIKKEGNAYNITVSDAQGIGFDGDDGPDENHEDVTISLNLNGTLSPLPEKYRE